jgi:dUTP pyrophosphatase
MEIIRTICNEGGCYKQLHVVDSASPEIDMNHNCPLQRLEFTNELDASTITPSPFTVRYYTNQTTIKSSSTNTIPIKVQLDGGANRSITNNPAILTRYQPTPGYAIYGVNKDDVALTCTARGYIPWAADNGDIVYVPCYYSPDAAETIISPTDVVMSHSHLYTAWGQFAHVLTGQGHITFYRTDGTNHTTFSLRMQNGLWYNDTDILHCFPGPTTAKSKQHKAIAHRLTGMARYELWHQRSCHCGKQKLTQLHKHVDGFGDPLKGNAFWLCASCVHASQTARAIHQAPQNTISQDHRLVTLQACNELDWLDLVSPITVSTNLAIGEYIHMDFGFPRGKSLKEEDKDGRIICSIDGYRCYLLIIERKTRYIRIMLGKTKHPPLTFVEKYLEIHGRKEGRRVVRTDKGGELFGSYAFRQVVEKFNYIIEPTAPNAAFQNAHAERPNRTLGNWMRCILHASGLGPEYWSFALLHTASIYNMLPHSATRMTPHYALTGQKPKAEQFRIFGCTVFIKKAGKRPHKLDYHTSTGKFLGFTSTSKNIYYMDQDTHKVKTATHVVFDEANYTLAKHQRTSASQALIDLGYAKEDFTTLPPLTTSQHPITTEAQVQLLSSLAKLPVRGTMQAAGYDVFSTKSCQLEPQMITEIPLDITIQPPPGTYVHIFPHSSLARKGISIYAGIIAPDYRGNIIVLLHNASSKALPVQQGDRIAQIIYQHYSTADLALTTNIDHTPRETQGFGSTGTTDIPTSHTIAQKDLGQDMPYNIYLSDDPFDDYITITVQDFGHHETMGMVLQQCPHRQRH